HRVSTVLSGLMRYTALFSTPETSTTGVNCVLTCGVEVAAVPGWVGDGLVGSGGLISDAWASTVTVVTVEVTAAPLPELPWAAWLAACARLAVDPPRAAAYTVPSGMGTMARISGSGASRSEEHTSELQSLTN